MDPNNIAHVEEERIRHSDSHAGRYVAVWAALMVLTAITWLLARFVHIPGGWGVTAALVIAGVKGTLVALFFMHLWDQQGANRLVFATSIVFVALLATLTILDNATRFPLANPPNDPFPSTEPPAARSGGH